MITKMDANGRVSLPLGIRYRLDLNEGDCLAVDYLGDGTIILKKIVSQPKAESVVAQRDAKGKMLVISG